ncbi:uncharacterized protein [Onthophagus taurus]|uniref:uncharacterized protein isoform X2 n=1 Tax=Onthophagus taurus TaxID=166361 RepID=UPI000C206585|nr:uncharacterized protein LOC111428860 isoform X2 [Onthophagus taurus]
MTSESTPVTDEDLFNQCLDNFYTTASIQGRVAYLLMSVYAVNPNIWHRFTLYNPSHILFSNMIYGAAVHIYSRPAMRPISGGNRIVFSILGSMMFNYSSMLVFEFLKEKLDHRPILLTLLGFICGRMMMLHFLSYLYHVDRISRVDRNFRRNPAFDSMYS